MEAIRKTVIVKNSRGTVFESTRVFKIYSEAEIAAREKKRRDRVNELNAERHAEELWRNERAMHPVTLAEVADCYNEYRENVLDFMW